VTEEAAGDSPAHRAAADDEGGETRLAETLDRIVEEGRPRLHRSPLDLFATGGVAGIEVSLGVLALLFVDHETGSMLLAGLAFSFGFIALQLGHSELFTEGFLVPVTVVAAGEATVWQMIRFWVGTALANLAGGWLLAWIAMSAFPQLRATATAGAHFFIQTGITGRSMALAVLAGAVITLMTRMNNGTESVPARLVATIASGFMLAGLRLSHSILESILMFCALHTPHAGFGYLDWLGWFGWTVIGNVLGGIGLVTLLRLARSRRMLVRHREETSTAR
jgi:formate/nitrite transporter FocA (FNT family)